MKIPQINDTTTPADALELAKYFGLADTVAAIEEAGLDAFKPFVFDGFSMVPEGIVKRIFGLSTEKMAALLRCCGAVRLLMAVISSAIFDLAGVGKNARDSGEARRLDAIDFLTTERVDVFADLVGLSPESTKDKVRPFIN